MLSSPDELAQSRPVARVRKASILPRGSYRCFGSDNRAALRYEPVNQQESRSVWPMISAILITRPRLVRPFLNRLNVRPRAPVLVPEILGRGPLFLGQLTSRFDRLISPNRPSASSYVGS